MKRSRIAWTIIPPLVILLVAGSAAAAEEELWEAAQEPDPPFAASEPPGRPDEERQVAPLEQKGGTVGYSFLKQDGYGGRALEYGALRSSRSGGLFYRNLKRDSNLELEGYYLNGDDYHADLLVDYLGDYRLHLRTESLFHNLDRELLFSTPFESGRTDAPTPAEYLPVQDPAADYGVSVVQDKAEFRYRLHNYPLHLNLGYWRYSKEGTIQQRFADASFEGTPNTIYAVPREIEHRTQEGRVGLDAHLGPVDLVYDFKVRVFEDREPTPVAAYVARNDVNGNPEVTGGARQHNEEPDSRLIAHTLKLHTSLAGGLVGSGSYSFERRENLSELTDTTGVKHHKVDLQNAAGDLVYTPAKEYTFTFRYRRQELDHEDLGPVASVNFVDPLQVVKPPVDSTRDQLSGTLSFRPAGNISLTGGYRVDFLERSHVSDLPSPTSWALPEHSTTQTASLVLFYRPVKAVRSSASYSYVTTDHPSYGSSFQEKHEGKLLVTYTRCNSWGASASALIRREWNDEVEHFLVNFPLDPLGYTPYPLTSRERRTENANLALWYVPVARLTLGANYAYLRSRVDQAVLFTGVAVGSEAGSDFYSRSRVFGVNASWSPEERLDLSLMLQQVRSQSAFGPDYVVFSATSDTGGIRDITRQKTVMSSLSARAEYHFTREISSLLDYTLRDYDEKNPVYSMYNGTVHAVVASVAARW